MNPNFVTPCHPPESKQESQLYCNNPSPSELDCISGRGRRVYNHIGNARFRIIIAFYMEKYRKAKKIEKAQIVFSIIDQFRRSGGNFVKQDRHTKRWIEISNYDIKNKVSHALRDAISSTNTMESHDVKTDQKLGFSETRNSCAADRSELNHVRIAKNMKTSNNLIMSTSNNTSARTRNTRRISRSTTSCSSSFNTATMFSSVVSDEECMANAVDNRNVTTLPQHTAEIPVILMEPSATIIAGCGVTEIGRMDKEQLPAATNSWKMESDEKLDRSTYESREGSWWPSTHPQSSSLLLSMTTKSPSLVQPINGHSITPLMKPRDYQYSAPSCIDDIEEDEFTAFISKVFFNSGQDDIDKGLVE